MRWDVQEWVARGKAFAGRPVLTSRPIRWFSLGRGLMVALLLFSVGVFYVRTVRPGHRWAGDFSLYVRHAHNLANGLPYGDTRFIPNPHFVTYSPSAYPPVYPALLSVIYKFRGPQLDAMKYIGIGGFLAALLVLYAWLRRDLSFTAMLAFLAVLGFQPVFWDFKDMVYADLPFMGLTFLALLVWEKIRSRRDWTAALLGGVLVYLAYGTRSVGLVLAPVIVLGDLLRARRPAWVTWRGLAVAAALVVLQGVLIHRDSFYLQQFSWSWGRSIGFVRDYVGMAMAVWDNGPWPGLKTILFLSTALAAAAGYILRLRWGVRDLEIFVPIYGAVMVFWSSMDGIRYLFPILPFYFYYALVGLEGWLKAGHWRNVVLLGWLAAAGLTYGLVYAQTSFGPFLDNVRAPESRAVFRSIRQNIASDAVLVAREPRVFSLYTGRRFAPYHVGPDAELWEFFHQIRAGYIVVGRHSMKDREFLSGFIGRYGNDLEEIFSNYDFRVYRIRRFPGV